MRSNTRNLKFSFDRPTECSKIKICVLLQASIQKFGNARFATAACARMYEIQLRDRPTESCETVHPAKSKCVSGYSGVQSNIWNVRFATEACAEIHETSQPRGRQLAASKTIILPQFWTSDEQEVTKRLLSDVKNLRLATVLDVRRSLFALKVVSRSCVSPQFWNPTSTK